MYGVFSFNIVDMVALYWNNRTDPISLVYSSISLNRLAVPVVYNAMNILMSKEAIE